MSRYCGSCGTESTQGLNYCKKCGANLGIQPPTEFKPRPIRATGLFWSVALVTIGGLGILMGSIIALAALGISREDVFIPIVTFGCFTVLAVAWMLVRQISRLIDRDTGAAQTGPRRITAPPRLESRGEPERLPEAPMGIPSVTEHTTRRFQKNRQAQSATGEETILED